MERLKLRGRQYLLKKYAFANVPIVIFVMKITFRNTVTNLFFIAR